MAGLTSETASPNKSQQKPSRPSKREPSTNHAVTPELGSSSICRLLPATPLSANNDDLRAKVLRQVEYWLSDDYLKKDETILKKMKGGWLPISQIAQPKQMKRLNASVEFIADSLRSSQNIIVSDDGRQLRRRVPFSMEKALSADVRTIVVRHLPDNISKGELLASFSASGDIEHIHIVEAKQVYPSSRKGAKPPVPVYRKAYAFIRFADLESAIAQVTEAQALSGGWRAEALVELKCGLRPSEARAQLLVAELAGREADEQRRALLEALAAGPGAGPGALGELDVGEGAAAAGGALELPSAPPSVSSRGPSRRGSAYSVDSGPATPAGRIIIGGSAFSPCSPAGGSRGPSRRGSLGGTHGASPPEDDGSICMRQLSFEAQAMLNRLETPQDSPAQGTTGFWGSSYNDKKTGSANFSRRPYPRRRGSLPSDLSLGNDRQISGRPPSGNTSWRSGGTPPMHSNQRVTSTSSSWKAGVRSPPVPLHRAASEGSRWQRRGSMPNLSQR